MASNVKISPVVCAALGAAVAFYCLFPLYHRDLISIHFLLVLTFIPLVLLCLFRVLASYPLLENDNTGRLIRLMPIWVTAFSAGLALGIGAGVQAAPSTSFGLPQDSIMGISGIVLDDPRLISGGRAMSAVSLRMVMGSGGVRATARGDITVFFQEESAERLREFGRGAEVFAEGNLRAGTDSLANTYTFNAETLHITEPAPSLERFRTRLRRDLTQRFADSSGNAPWSGLALALLLGIRDNLDTGFSAQYRDAGCSFLLALSGMHLAVLIGIISFLLKKPLGLRPAAISGACIIVAYCFIVGPLPSLNRSALMYLLGVLAVLGMLKRDALLLLCMAFLIQLVLTPQAGLSLSFMLSYLALAGILIIGNLINNIFKGTVPSFFLQPVSASLGAFIATAGIVTWFFNDLRPVGIIASLILAPLTMVFMLGSMVWLGLDLLFSSLSFLIGTPLSLMYWLMEKTASLASYVPGIRAHPLVVLFVSLLITALLVWLDYRRCKASGRLESFT